MNPVNLPDGWVEVSRQQRADGMWTYAARSTTKKSKTWRGSKIYYPTLNEAVEACIVQIERIISQQKQKAAWPSRQPKDE